MQFDPRFKNRHGYVGPKALIVLGCIMSGNPSMRDLMDATGISSLNGITFILTRLATLGLIEREYYRGRTLRARVRVERLA